MTLLRRRHAALLSPPDPGQYGLLVAVATVFDDYSARTAQQLLGADGVRSTLAADPAHWTGTWPWHRIRRQFVLVFPESSRRAYDILSRHAN